MAAPNPFAARYKQLSSVELLEILDQPENYQALAVQAAREELEIRSLSGEQLDIANQELNEKKLKLQEEEDKKALRQLRKKQAIQDFAKNLNPVQQSEPSTEKLIKIICLVYGAIFLYDLVTSFDVYLAFFSDLPSCGIYCAIPALIFVLTPVAIISFWLKKKIGWITLVFLISFAITQVIQNIVLAIPDSFSNSSGLSGLLFPKPRIESYIWPLVFNAGLLLAAMRKNIRTVFKIDKNRLLWAVLGGVAVFALMHLNLYSLEWY